MEEIIDIVINKGATFIVWPYLISFMLLSYLAKDTVNSILMQLTHIKWKLVYTVLVIASILVIPFIFLADHGWEKLLVTYTVGTSLHELIFGFIEKKLKKE